MLYQTSRQEKASQVGVCGKTVEESLARKVCRDLDASLSELPKHVLSRLEHARSQAQRQRLTPK